MSVRSLGVRGRAARFTRFRSLADIYSSKSLPCCQNPADTAQKSPSCLSGDPGLLPLTDIVCLSNRCPIWQAWLASGHVLGCHCRSRPLSVVLGLSTELPGPSCSPFADSQIPRENQS